MGDIEVLILHGSPGAGKSTVAGAIAERLREADLAHAVIDVDELAIVYPHQGPEFWLKNLELIWPNYSTVPGLRAIIPTVISDEEQLASLRRVLPATRFMVCELTARRLALEERVTSREPNDFWTKRLLNWVDIYHRRTDLDDIKDFEVSTDQQSVAEAAREVMQQAGWLIDSTP